MAKYTPKKTKHTTDKILQPVSFAKNKIAPSTNFFDKKTLFYLISILAITIVIYIPAINNGFTNWDDQEYVTNNKDIQKLNVEQVKHFFSTFKMGNYHPLTMLSYAVEYKFSKLNPKLYHLDNLLFHLINISLVFMFIQLLCRLPIISFVTALLFAIHPMHVESVAWVAERKDVGYALFYLAALCTYLKYIEKSNAVRYSIVLLLFIISVLFKAVAVTLPVTLILIDYYKRRPLSQKTILEKLPFFIISVIFGVIAIYAQRSFEAIQELNEYGLFDRILFVSYGFTAYLWKIIYPFHLAAFYQYPLKNGAMYPWVFYSGPFLLIVLAFFIYAFRKNRDVLFGFAFYFITILLVIQLLPVGGAIIADRYSYLPYIGIFFIAGIGINSLMEKKNKAAPSVSKFKPFFISVLVAASLMFAFLSFERCKIWKDNITLWNDVLKTQKTSPKVYNNIGDAYNIAKQYDKAIENLSQSLALKPDYPDAYYNRSLSYYYLGKENENSGNINEAIKYYDKAIEDDSQAIKYNPKLQVAWFNRSGTYYAKKQYKLALDDALKSKELGADVDPNYIEYLELQIKATTGAQ